MRDRERGVRGARGTTCSVYAARCYLEARSKVRPAAESFRELSNENEAARKQRPPYELQIVSYLVLA